MDGLTAKLDQDYVAYIKEMENKVSGFTEAAYTIRDIYMTVWQYTD